MYSLKSSRWRIKIVCHPMLLVPGTAGLARPRGAWTPGKRSDGMTVLGDDHLLAMEQVVDQLG